VHSVSPCACVGALVAPNSRHLLCVAAIQAVKVMSKSRLAKKRQFKRQGRRVTVTTALDKAKVELAILKKVRHSNVVRCFEIINDPDVDELYLSACPFVLCRRFCLLCLASMSCGVSPPPLVDSLGAGTAR